MELEHYVTALKNIDGLIWRVIGAMEENIDRKKQDVTKQNPFNFTHTGAKQVEGAILTKINVKGISVDHKPRKDGRYQARYTIDGKQHSVYGKTPEEAQRKALAGYKGQKKEEKKSLTYAEWYSKWIELYKKNKLRPSSLKSYNYTTNKHIIPAIGKIKLNLLDTNKLQETINRIEQPRQREIAGNIIYASITKAYAVGLIKTNPALGIEKAPHKYNERRSLTSDELSRLMQHIKGNRFEDLIYVYVYTGLRRSEALALRWQDINLEKRTLTVKYQVNEKRELVEPKTSKAQRTLPILPPLYERLAAMDRTGEFLFTWKPSRITQEFRILFDEIGLTDIDVHSLRHTFTTMLKDLHVPEDLRTKWLGHSKLEHKDRYEHIRSEYEIIEINKLLKQIDTKSDTDN